MNIALLGESFPPIEDGVAQVVLNSARLLQDRGHDVSVLTAKVPGVDYATPYPFNVVGIPSIPIPFRKPYRAEIPAWSIPASHACMNIPYDIVHAHSPATSGHLAYRLAQRNHIPFVITFHTKFRDDLLRALRSDRLTDVGVHRIMRIYDKADEVWVPQLSVLDVMREYGYKGDAFVMPNATEYSVDEALVPSLQQEAKAKLRSLTGDGDKHILLFVGQMIWEKNIRFILEALEQLPASFPFHAFFVGKGYALDEFTQLVKDKGMADRVTAVGQIDDRQEMEMYYFAADLFLFPSIYDNAPLVVREAAAHHIPAILMRGSTSAEVVTEGQNGFLTDNSPAAMRDVIMHALQDTNRLTQMGHCAAKTIGRTWSDVVPEIEDRYQFLIHHKKQH